MNTLPKPLEELIELFNDLPGIGPRSAARLGYFFLRAPDQFAQKFARSLSEINEKIKLCESCYNYTDSKICPVCADSNRNIDIIMVVEEPLDVVAFERMGKFSGLYHVLGGVVSPLNGIGPDEIRINELIIRLKNNTVQEVIIATNPNLEGESTSLFIKKEIDSLGKEIKVSRLARGLPTGADLDYADDMTLQKALEGRGEL